MKAYIVHIKREYLQGSHSTTSKEVFKKEENVYSAWCTERQAFAYAARFIINCCDWRGELGDARALISAIKFLFEHKNYKDIISLVNEQTSVGQPYSNFGEGPSKFTITVKESTFQGSPFE